MKNYHITDRLQRKQGENYRGIPYKYKYLSKIKI